MVIAPLSHQLDSRVTAGQGCGDGLVEYPEQCDDNNTVSADGCSVNCSVEEHFECMNSPETSSMCTAILLDLNVDDNATLNNSLEYYDINTPVFFVDPTMLEFFLRPAVVSFMFMHVHVLINSACDCLCYLYTRHVHLPFLVHTCVVRPSQLSHLSSPNRRVD